MVTLKLVYLFVAGHILGVSTNQIAVFCLGFYRTFGPAARYEWCFSVISQSTLVLLLVSHCFTTNSMRIHVWNLAFCDVPDSVCLSNCNRKKFSTP